jgi:hypothetical protein
MSWPHNNKQTPDVKKGYGLLKKMLHVTSFVQASAWVFEKV